MSLYPSAVLQRSTLTFCVAGLHPKDELIFKAFVRLLDHLTHQHWRYQAPTDGLTVELLVIADGVLTEYRGAKPPQYLRLRSKGLPQPGFVHWPLKSDELEKELNRAGGQVLADRAKPSSTARPAQTEDWPAATVGARAAAMRLRQWPPADLLNGAGHMRLAALLTGKAITLDELADRSKLPLALCESFLAELHRAQLLIVSGNATDLAPHLAVSAPKSLQVGLLTRIRLSLGIF